MLALLTSFSSSAYSLWNRSLNASGVDGGRLEACVTAVGVERLLWGCDITLDTGFAKLRYLERLLDPDQYDAVGGGNAQRIFPAGSFAREG